MQFIHYGFVLFWRMMFWAFTRGWPVGVGFVVGGFIGSFLGYESLTIPVFIICMLGGYAFIYRYYLFPPKE